MDTYVLPDLPRQAPGAPRPPATTRRMRAYARLAKLDVLDYYLSVPLVAALALPAAGPGAGRAAAVLGLFLLGELALVAGMVAFDDVTGFRDGSDAANYGPDVPARRLARKPLVAGTLTERQAIRFAWVCVAAAAALWSATVALAPHRPLWAVAGTGVCLVLGFQYSWWLKLSYHGFQELYLAALGWAFVLLPDGLLTGRATAFAVVAAAVFGLGPVLFGVYSNINDVAGDRAVGRITVATVTGPRGNARFIAAVSALEAAVLLGAAPAGAAPWWFPLLLAPVPVLRAAQYVRGIGRGDVLAARRGGIRLHRLATALTATAAVLVGVAR